MSVHKVTKADKAMAGTDVESDSDAIDCKLQPLSKPIAKLLSDMRSKIKRMLADPNVELKPNVETTAENG